MIVRQFFRRFAILITAMVAAGSVPAAFAEDGYELWLRYAPLSEPPRSAPRHVMAACSNPSDTLRAALDEIDRATEAMLGAGLPRTDTLEGGTLVLASPDCSDALTGLPLPPAAQVGTEGFAIREVRHSGRQVTLISAQSDIGVLYGTFDYLLRMVRGEELTGVNILSRPKTKLRLLNHWDNLDRHVERGYSGQSIWDWHRLPGYLDPRYTDYARANASIGINGVSLTNVNADATVLTPHYLEKVAALADVFRPYGIKVYLTARFSAPMELDGLSTADPRDPAVQAWWQTKVDEIYTRVPDFGGFLVKANSEGQPGPQDYGRSHAEGANMLARALAPHNGKVMWRAFVYSAEEPEDRVKQAYTEFLPLDGQVADNVLVQVKNGPLDFQPREPFHPLFGAMPETPLMMELQITKEYLGFSTHLAYLGKLWEEVLSAETHAVDERASVASIIDGTAHGYEITGMAGVANIGSDRNWSGSIFDQANWYAFGRLAWDPDASAEAIARDWTELTFSLAPEVADAITQMMMGSREAVVNYMTPLGLTHLMGTGHHYGPAPWVDDLGRADWTPYYYHKATQEAVGFDRTETGSGAVDQYAGPVAQEWASLDTVPDELLLWFHRVGWDHELDNGNTLWQELVRRYDLGVSQVAAMQEVWASLEDEIDADRFEEVSAFLAIQSREAVWWRDASIAYWQSVNGMPLPEGAAPPAHDLAYYKALSFPNAPGQGE